MVDIHAAVIDNYYNWLKLLVDSYLYLHGHRCVSGEWVLWLSRKTEINGNGVMSMKEMCAHDCLVQLVSPIRSC